jgi:uncharacterized coiled-coil protein SlyX
MAWRSRAIRDVCLALAAAAMLAAAPAPAQQAAAQAGAAEVRAAADYAARMNRLTERFYAVVDLSLELDDLSIAVAEGRLPADRARGRGDVVIAEMRRALADATAEAADPPAPPDFESPRMARSVVALQATLDRVRGDAEQAVADSVALFEAALSGDPDVFAAIERRQFDNALDDLQAETEAIAASLGTLAEGTPAHDHFRIVERLNLALIDALRALRPVLDGGAVDRAGLDEAEAGLAEGRRLIDAAEASLDRLLARLDAQGMPPEIGEANAELVRAAFATFEDSFRVEGEVADQLEAVVAALRDADGTAAEGYDARLARLDELIARRMGLIVRRQDMFRGLQ